MDDCIRSSVAGYYVLTIVECRDHKSRRNVTQVDGVHSKQLEVGAHKAVLVSRSGYSKTARQKASRLGISLYNAGEAADAPSSYPLVTRAILDDDH